MATPGGAVLKKKDVLAASDREALNRASESRDCPICDVLRDGQLVGSPVADQHCGRTHCTGGTVT